jgi:tetratricopeptide (TPR) repeat protein
LNNTLGEQHFRTILSEITAKFVSTNILDKESAFWTTIVWAMSLKKVTDHECQQIITTLEVPFREKKDTQSIVPLMHDPVSNPILIDPGAIKYMHEHGKRLHNEGNYSEAIKCYDKALLINSLDHNILSDKGLSLHNSGNYSEAIKCYDKALLINSQDEFINRRRNNTMTLLQKQVNSVYSPQEKSISFNSLNSKSKLSNPYVICIMLAVSAITAGIVFYVMSGIDNNENANSSIMDQDIYKDDSVKNTGTSSLELTTKNKLDQASIGEFTESVENQIKISSTNDKVFSENNSINQNPDVQQSYNLELNENEDNEVNQKVDNFKLELEKAMESNFN